MAARHCLFINVAILAVLFASSCSRDDRPPAPPVKTAPPVIVKTRPKTMTEEQKLQLGFPPDIVGAVEGAAGATAEPFFEDVMMRSANLKGDVMIATAKLCGFSVHTRDAEEVIAGLSRPFRSRGFLIFRSEHNYGSVPDVVTVIRGESSYDILRVQKTESPHYNLSTADIIKWLRARQKEASFVVTGAGADWVEATFIRQPRNMRAFARQVVSFAPDVLREGPSTADKLADRMAMANGFHLVWD